MENLPQAGSDDKMLAQSPTIRSLDQRLQLLTRLVARIDDRQQAMEEMVKHVLDNTNRIIALLMPSQEP